MTTSPRRLRSLSVTLGVTALVAGGLTGCAPQYDQNSQGICVDPTTQKRVDDDYCDEDSPMHTGGYSWFYLSNGSRVPNVGSPYKASRGTFTAPEGTTSKAGGSGSHVTRGGFGGGGHASS